MSDGGIDLKAGDVDDRLGFVRKVYMILFAQLGVTAGFTAIAITSEDMASWMQEEWWMNLIAVLLAVIL